MAYDNWEIHTLSDDASDSGDWTRSTGTDGWALIDDDVDSPDTSDYISESTQGLDYRMDLNGFSRDPQQYEFIRVRYHARRVGGTSCYCRWQLDNSQGVDGEDLTTSWATYENYIAVQDDIQTTAQIDGTEAYTTNTNLELVLKCRSTGGAEIQLAAIEISTMTLADHGYLVWNADGTTANWSLSTGSDSYALVDNIAGLGASDWANNDDTTDYIYTSTDSQVVEIACATPTYTGLVAGDGVVVWVFHDNVTDSSNTNNAFSFDLINGTAGTSFTRHNHSHNGLNVAWSHAGGRWSMECLTLTSTPTDWADVELRITSNTLSSREFRFYTVMVIGPFDYVPVTTGSISEGVSVGDTMARVMTSPQAISEGVSVGDTQAAIATALGALTEGVAVGDTQAAIATALGALSEGVSVGDTMARVMTAGRSFAEGVNVGDTQAATATALASVSEGVNLGETYAAVATALATINEGTAVGDAFGGIATILASLSEGVAVGDSWSALQLFLASITEGISVGDTQAAVAVAAGYISEGIAAGDLFAGIYTAVGAISEGLSVGDTYLATATALASITEAITVGESWSYPLEDYHLLAVLSNEPLLTATVTNDGLLVGTISNELQLTSTVTVN